MTKLMLFLGLCLVGSSLYGRMTDVSFGKVQQCPPGQTCETEEDISGGL